MHIEHLCEIIGRSVEYGVIDVLNNSRTAMKYNILTPPAPRLIILGNISDSKRILMLLDYKELAR